MQDSTRRTLYSADVSSQTQPTTPEVNSVALGPSLGPTVARYDSRGNATAGGVTTPPANAGEALSGALAGMVGDIRGRNTQYADVPMPSMPSNTETQTVVIQKGNSSSKLVLLGTLFCVAAAGVTLYQARHKHG